MTNSYLYILETLALRVPITFERRETILSTLEFWCKERSWLSVGYFYKGTRL